MAIRRFARFIGVCPFLAACGGASRAPTDVAASTTPVSSPPSADNRDRAAPSFAMPAGVGPRTFRLLGPFPNVPAADRHGRSGLDHDYLSSLGGETTARIGPDTRVPLEGRDFAVKEATLDAASTLDFQKAFGADTDSKTAYAYAEWTVAAPVRALAVFGSDDAAEVWLDGHLVHRAASDRALIADSDRFEMRLEAGTNRLLVKVDNGSGGWGFALRILDEPGQRAFSAWEARRHFESFEPASASDEYLLDQSFPDIVWSHQGKADQVVGGAAPSVHWYGPDLAPSERPDGFGQYTAVVESRTLDGLAFRQMVAFAKVPPDAVPSVRSPPTHELPRIEASWPFEVHLDERQRAEMSRHFWFGLAAGLRHGRDSAVAALALSRLAASPPAAAEPIWLSSGYIAVAETELALRMALERRTPAELRPPQTMATPAPELRDGSEAQAGVRPGTAARIRAVAAGWAKADEHPFVVLVARHGRVFFHEAFNGFRRDSTFYPASIGKTIAALTFARAVDQGLVSFDQPVGSVLADWRDARTAKLTFRGCFNHVSGLTGHASHGGMFNPFLDDALFVEDGVFARPMTHFRYNGDDMDLAGKALELVTGRPIWRLLYEHMEKPFEEPVEQLDLGFGDSFTATYLAKVGQMLLQDGAYGKLRFFRPGFLATLRPRKIVESAPDFDDPHAEGGIGLTWMPDPPGARERGVLGPNVVGHGASSGTTWRVDPDHDLVIVVGRDAFDDSMIHDAWQTKLVTAVAEGLLP